MKYSRVETLDKRNIDKTEQNTIQEECIKWLSKVGTFAHRFKDWIIPKCIRQVMNEMMSRNELLGLFIIISRN